MKLMVYDKILILRHLLLSLYWFSHVLIKIYMLLLIKLSAEFIFFNIIIIYNDN